MHIEDDGKKFVEHKNYVNASSKQPFALSSRQHYVTLRCRKCQQKALGLQTLYVQIHGPSNGSL